MTEAMENENRLSLDIFRDMIRNGIRLTRIVWGEKKSTIIGLAIVFLVISATPFLQSGASGLLINNLVKDAGTGILDPAIIWLTAIVILATLIPSLLSAVRDYLLKTFWLFMEAQFDTMVIKKKGEIDIAVHEDPQKQDLFNRVKEEGTWRLRSFIDREFFILQNVLEAVIAAAIIFFFRWWIFLILLAGTIPELWVEAKYGREVWSIHAIRSERRRKYWSLRWQFEELAHLVELKLFQNAGYFLAQIKELFHSFQAEQRRNEQKRLHREMIALIVSQAAIAFATVYFILEVVNGGLMIGTLVFVLASIAGLRQALGGLFMNLGQQYQDSLFVTDIFKLLDIQPVLAKPVAGFVLPRDQTPEIVFENVSFAYPGTDKIVLKDFSLTIKPGEKVALIGANGAGKTTIVKLLCRFYDPIKGRILIGGHDIREIDIESWYRILGALFQDYSHYNFLVKDVIALGRTEFPLAMNQVKNAARSSEADIFIEEWKNKYEQMLGKDFTGGIEPSIGQWQKLAIARAFYRNARVLILDEPTASIDAEAEAKIFDRLESETQGKTVILISHRFSTVRHATQIAVLENGRLKELGTHEKLLKKKGLYARLFNLQAKGYK